MEDWRRVIGRVETDVPIRYSGLVSGKSGDSGQIEGMGRRGQRFQVDFLYLLFFSLVNVRPSNFSHTFKRQ